MNGGSRPCLLNLYLLCLGSWERGSWLYLGWNSISLFSLNYGCFSREKSEPERTLFINAKVLCKNVLNGMKVKIPTTALAIISYSRQRGSERGHSFHIHLENEPAQRTYLANQPSFRYLISRPSLSSENFSSSHPLVVIAFWHLLPEAIYSCLLEKARRSPWSRHLSFEKERSPVVQYCPPTQCSGIC
jgi:hypothetical protein